MNSKFLYAATIAVSLISTLAMADQAPASRTRVNADLRQAIANGTLQRTDYPAGSDRALASRSTLTRQQVVVELARAGAARTALTGPDANRMYNPYGTQVLDTSTLARSEVTHEVLQAQADGTLQRTDYDDEQSLARKANQRAHAPKFAQRLKAMFAYDAS